MASVELTAIATLADGSDDPNATYDWSNSDSTIAAIQAAGAVATVVAAQVGACTVTVTATDPSGKSLSAAVDVTVSAGTAGGGDMTGLAIDAADPQNDATFSIAVTAAP
jgi:hypothetical protein